MIVSYFPGCTLRTKAKELDNYARRSAQALGITLEELENWQCCGGVFSMGQDEIATKLSSVRALAQAQAKDQILVSVCSACHNVLKQTNHHDYKTSSLSTPHPFHTDNEFFLADIRYHIHNAIS